MGLPGAFSQILTNLIMNSLLHGFEDLEEGQIRIAVKANNNSILPSYSDNGKGMIKEQLERVFDPFYTTNPNKSELLKCLDKYLEGLTTFTICQLL